MVIKSFNTYHPIFAVYLSVLISVLFHPALAIRSIPSGAHRAQRRPALSCTERGHHPEYQGSKKACLASWGVSSEGCSFGASQRNRDAAAEVNEISQKTVKRGSVGQGILGRVRDWSVC